MEMLGFNIIFVLPGELKLNAFDSCFYASEISNLTNDFPLKTKGFSF